MIKLFLQTKLTEVLSDRFQLNGPVHIEVPAHTDHGDFATNVAFTLAKTERKAPALIAEDIATILNETEAVSSYLQASSLNGFVNITLRDAWLWELFLTDTAPQFPEVNDQILLEYISANPTGPLHIGHGRWAVLGSVIEKLCREVGMSISTEFYVNDAGNQVNNLRKSVEAVKTGQPIPEDGYHGQYIHDIAESDEDPLRYNLDLQQEVLKKMSVEFDTWFSESTLHKNGAVEASIEVLKKKGMTYEHEGALWFKSSELGDEKDRVLVKGDGAYTYFVVDIAYHYDKLQRGFTKLINIFGADHHGYVPRLRAAVSTLADERFMTDEAFHVVIGQLVSLKRDGEPVRMSKRTGEMITLLEVVDEIGPDALRYFLAEKSSDTHVDFDMGLAVKRSSDNPVFYVQYAHARLCSVLNKARSEQVVRDDSDVREAALDPKERQLMMHVVKRYDALWESAQALAPHKHVHYCYELARAIQHFYEACPLLSASPHDQQKRLEIVTRARDVLAWSLALLGISAPEAM